MDEECKLAKLLPAVFEWECYPIVVGGSESRVYLGWDTGLSRDVCGPGREAGGRTSSICGYEDIVGLVWDWPWERENLYRELSGLSGTITEVTSRRKGTAHVPFQMEANRVEGNKW